MARIDVKMLEPLFLAVEGAAKQDDVSPGRWIGKLLAHHFGIPEEQAVPKPKPMGRPRKSLSRAS